jgi:hypothetical protein
LAACQFVKCIALFVGPALVFIFVQDESSNPQWQRIFLTISICLLVSNVIFMKWATSKPAEYTIVGPELTADMTGRRASLLAAEEMQGITMEPMKK